MTSAPRNLSTDLRGVGNLTIDAIIGLTDIVEALHHTIGRSAGILGAPAPNRTTGITGLVYRNIRAVTKWVGSGLDVSLNQLSFLLNEADSFPAREAVLAALNGVLGDHLAATENPLAIPMQFRQNGRELSALALAESIQQSEGRLVIMMHGLCMNDLQWHRRGHDYGQALAHDFGFEPLYLHYNTGLHISENGQKFSEYLESLCTQSAQPLELVVIAYSMGGLVLRSAYHYGEKSGYSWPNALQKIVFLGTPHHGAPLEKGGNWINTFLDISPYSAPFSRLGKIRSSGLTDLRYGYILDDDWQGRDRFELSGDQRVPMPLPSGVQCCAIAATTGKDSSKLGHDLVGDGLVPVKSALGQHNQAEFNLSFPETQQWIGRNMNHIDLINHPEVYEAIKMWLKL